MFHVRNDGKAFYYIFLLFRKDLGGCSEEMKGPKKG